MTLPLILLAGVGMWFLLEGAAYAVAPDFMRRLAVLVTQMSTRELTMAGLVGGAVGIVLIWLAVHLG
ncbi:MULTISPECIES: DUF2065 domain-containing protein [Hyphomonas]|uniref:DUF2065 domain-containing protein n=2 Tax=Hyphomonas adhaerens TaxID=81029 RepID=A0A069E369_9PROT|nr:MULTISPECIES: DUF2065 domain-containing protein [Hyphomonas]KCZ84367.1 hypothetical protein HAD_01770 [Hyphomonas adhaerens MHS-3]MBB38963.1 DUF2065 domain-containing protein [Hyphomonas sp.]HAE26525.1 DUF2065 domain-containing protein [Hyphomonas adhaerens]|tara:strand:- start:593 stop:793 length:201 start_codon:yes stop_codon:yes gene_type:complete